MKKIILSLWLSSVMLPAASQPVNINVYGYVTAMPCEIENTNYLIDLKNINVWGFKDTQRSPWVNFSIKLKNCPSATKESIIILTGTPDTTNPDYFINNGTAKNVALNLANGIDKALVKNGTRIVTPINNQTRTVEIPLSARVAGYNDGMHAGSFRSSVEFTFVYH